MMRRILFPVALLGILSSACAPDRVTGADLQAPRTPSFDGGGWVGGGGRTSEPDGSGTSSGTASDTTISAPTSAAAPGTGWVGGGGRASTDTTGVMVSAASGGWVGGGG